MIILDEYADIEKAEKLNQLFVRVCNGPRNAQSFQNSVFRQLESGEVCGVPSVVRLVYSLDRLLTASEAVEYWQFMLDELVRRANSVLERFENEKQSLR